MTWEAESGELDRIREADNDAYWRYREHFFELVPEPGQRTIEIGCGEGRVTRDLNERGHPVVAIDSAPTLLSAARALDTAGDSVLADAADLPFEDESFDLAIAYNSLMDIDDLVGAVREAWRNPETRQPLLHLRHAPDQRRRQLRTRRAVAAFHIHVYRGRRPFDESFERDDVTVRFLGWCYPLEGYARPLCGSPTSCWCEQ